MCTCFCTHKIQKGEKMKKRKNIIISAITCMMSICLMMFGVYAASNPSVSISGQVSYSARDAKVLVLGKVNGQAGDDSNVDYPSIADAQNPTESSVSLPAQYLGYTKGESAGSTADNLPQWNMGTTPHAFYEDSIGIRPIVISFKMTNLSNYPVVATVDFTGVTDANFASKNLTRETTGLKDNKVYLDKNVTKEISITYAVANDAVGVNGDGLLNMSITFEKTVFPTPTNVKNQQGETMQSDWEYEYDGDSFIITRYKKTRPVEGETFDASAVPTQVVIPSSVVCSDGKTYPVKKLGKVTEEQFKAIMSGELPESEMGNGPLFIDMSRVTDNTYLAALPSDIIVSEGIEVINPGALGLAFGVKTLPNSIKEIGSSSCFGTSITTVDLPNLIRIENSAFAYNGELYPAPITDFVIPSGLTNFDDPFDGCTTLENITCAENCTITNIPENAFKGWKSLQTVQIPNSVQVLGSDAFAYCTALKTVTFAQNSKLVSIGQGAFRECSSLTTVKIPDGVTLIDDFTFSNCSSLTAVEIPNGVTSINFSAFDGCSSLTKVDIPNSVTSIGFSAFSRCSSMTAINIPNDIECIKYDAFAGCTALKNENNLYGNAYYIGNQANPYLVLLSAKGTTITECQINSNTRFISGNAFLGCTSLAIITIPDNVKSIGDSTFSGCSSLTTIEIPYGVTSIDNSAFSKCSSLTNIEIPNSVSTIGGYAFSSCTALKNENNLHGNAYYIGNQSNPYLVLISAKSTTLTECQINSNTKFISDSAFSGCTSLTKITIPDSVKSIGCHAFSDCTGLKTINVPSSVTKIGSYAFASCTSLTSITINVVTPPDVFHIFDNCSKLTAIYVPAGSVEAYKAASGWSEFADKIQAMA